MNDDLRITNRLLPTGIAEAAGKTAVAPAADKTPGPGGSLVRTGIMICLS